MSAEENVLIEIQYLSEVEEVFCISYRNKCSFLFKSMCQANFCFSVGNRKLFVIMGRPEGW